MSARSVGRSEAARGHLVEATADQHAVALTLDDFGTGYSALSRLHRLPIDSVKIDKSFLEPISVGREAVIARAIIAMGKALGMRVVGEGVETDAQLAFLQREGCNWAQGYLLGRPLSGAALVERLSRERADGN